MPTNHYLHSVRWMTRLLGLIVNSFFLLTLFLDLINPDSALVSGWVVTACLAFCILSIFSAWRWERVGGALAMIGAVALCAAVFHSALAAGLVWQKLILAVIYPLPFLVVGSLFLTDAQSPASTL